MASGVHMTRRQSKPGQRHSIGANLCPNTGFLGVAIDRTFLTKSVSRYLGFVRRSTFLYSYVCPLNLTRLARPADPHGKNDLNPSVTTPRVSGLENASVQTGQAWYAWQACIPACTHMIN